MELYDENPRDVTELRELSTSIAASPTIAALLDA